MLRTEKVTAQQSAWYGAFVAMERPADGYGPFVLAFNKRIERMSPLSTHVFEGQGGFLQDIPVNNDTLSYIIIRDGLWVREAIKKQALVEGASVDVTHPDQIREWVSKKCKEWTGRDVKVLLEQEATLYMQKVQAMNLGFPKEWGQPKYGDLRESAKPQPSRTDFLPSRL
jgi:hypothetical protein